MTASPSIDLNADLGEGCPWDELLLARVSSASLSCGAHAGDPDAIRKTLRDAKARGISVGAHPGYPDREGFGRREQAISTAEVERLIIDQIADLAMLAEFEGLSIRFLKPHGALYNQGHRDPRIAEGIVAAAAGLNLPVLGQPGGEVSTSAERKGVIFIAEGFADRRYLADGRLAPRTEPDAILTDAEQIRTQVLRLVAQHIDTLCLHGDNPESVRLADLVRETLDRAGVAVRPFI